MEKTVPMEPSSFVRWDPGWKSTTSEVSLKAMVFTRSSVTGARQSAQTAIREKTPAEFRMIAAADKNTDAESDKIPPTMGSDLAMTVRADFTASASALPLMRPVRER